MSKVAVSGNKIAWLAQVHSRLPLQHSTKTLTFITPSLPSESSTEAIKGFYKLYLQKFNMLQSTESTNIDFLIAHHKQYCEDLIDLLNSLDSMNKHSKNSLPFKAMAIYTRAVQSALLNSTISYNILKLFTEFYPEKQIFISGKFEFSTFVECIKSGRLQDAITCFKNHPRHSASPLSAEIEACLSSKSRVFGYFYHDESEFLKQFEAISRKSTQLLRSCTHDEDLKKISLLISGNIEYFLTLNPTWLEYVIFYSLFVEGIISDTTSLAFTMKKPFSSLSGFDDLLLSTLLGNFHKSIQHASEIFPSFFISHIVDILATMSKLPSEILQEFDGLNYPEYYFSVFVNEMVPNTLIPVEIPCDYIFHNLGGLENCEEIMSYAALIRLQEYRCEDIVGYFERHGFEGVVETLYRNKTMLCMQNGDLENGLKYAIKSQSKELLYKVEKFILNLAVSSDREKIEELIGGFNKGLKADSSAISFLVSFLEYVQNIEIKNYIKAGEELVRFFLDDTAPEEFYEKILLESIPLFEAGLVLSYNNLIKVLEGFEKISNRFICRNKAKPENIKKISSILSWAASISLSSKS